MHDARAGRSAHAPGGPSSQSPFPFAGISPATARAVTDLPLPLSPTSPTIDSVLISKETSSTTLVLPRCPWSNIGTVWAFAVGATLTQVGTGLVYGPVELLCWSAQVDAVRVEFFAHQPEFVGGRFRHFCQLVGDLQVPAGGGAHLPDRFTLPDRRSWASGYLAEAKRARGLGERYRTLDQAEAFAERFISPLLADDPPATWDRTHGSWSCSPPRP